MLFWIQNINETFQKIVQINEHDNNEMNLCETIFT